MFEKNWWYYFRIKVCNIFLGGLCFRKHLVFFCVGVIWKMSEILQFVGYLFLISFVCASAMSLVAISSGKSVRKWKMVKRKFNFYSTTCTPSSATYSTINNLLQPHKRNSSTPNKLDRSGEIKLRNSLDAYINCIIYFFCYMWKCVYVRACSQAFVPQLNWVYIYTFKTRIFIYAFHIKMVFFFFIYIF